MQISTRSYQETMNCENSVINSMKLLRSIQDLADKGDLPQIIYLPSQGMLPTMDLHQ